MPPADLHALLLEEYFFSWVDRGVAVGATPLFTGPEEYRFDPRDRVEGVPFR